MSVTIEDADLHQLRAAVERAVVYFSTLKTAEETRSGTAVMPSLMHSQLMNAERILQALALEESGIPPDYADSAE